MTVGARADQKDRLRRQLETAKLNTEQNLKLNIAMTSKPNANMCISSTVFESVQ